MVFGFSLGCDLIFSLASGFVFLFFVYDSFFSARSSAVGRRN